MVRAELGLKCITKVKKILSWRCVFYHFGKNTPVTEVCFLPFWKKHTCHRGVFFAILEKTHLSHRCVFCHFGKNTPVIEVCFLPKLVKSTLSRCYIYKDSSRRALYRWIKTGDIIVAFWFGFLYSALYEGYIGRLVPAHCI